MSLSTSTLLIGDSVSSFPHTTCPSWFRREIFEDPENITIIVTLGIINAMVIAGNLLVVIAVFASAKLRTVTNFLIVSLAVSDLFLGLAVLPYSIALEVLDVWIFGELWCPMWLAVDVWLCTASILNLCAISIDRYLAITRPVHYRAIMSPVRVKLLIASVWVLSFIICFPPLVGWNDRMMDDEEVTAYSNVSVVGSVNKDGFPFNNTTINRYNDRKTGDFIDIAVFAGSNSTDAITFALNGTTNYTLDDTKFYIKTITSRCPRPQCGLIRNKGYVVYSALGSFYIPMLIMLFFYWKIYVAAIKTSRALSRGFKTTKSSRSSDDSDNVTLRIHRGKPSNDSNKSNQASRANTKSSNGRRRPGDMLVPRRLPTVVYHHAKEFSSPKCLRETCSGSKSYYTTTTTATSPGSEDPCCSSKSPDRIHKSKLTSFIKKSKEDNIDSTSPKMDHLTVDDCSSGNGSEKNGKAGKNLFSRISRRNVRWQAKRFKTEAKATKTVGIIVGGFILCWLPFFTVYLVVAFCGDCIPDLLFKIVFYLGYCNSALNPVIYGMVSKDFRFAFKKILCRCKLKDDGVSSLIRQIHMPTFFEEEDAIVSDTVSQT